MRNYKGGAIAAGVLCSIAATIAVWSGPLAAASGALHSNAAAPAQVSTVTHTGR
jgi:hypothetical protein